MGRFGSVAGVYPAVAPLLKKKALKTRMYISRHPHVHFLDSLPRRWEDGPPTTRQSCRRPPHRLYHPNASAVHTRGVILAMGKKGSPPFFFSNPSKSPPIFPGSRVPGMRGHQGDRYGQDLDVGRRLPPDTQDRVLSMSGPCVSTAPMLVWTSCGAWDGGWSSSSSRPKGWSGGKNGYRVTRTQPLLAGVCGFPSRVVATFATRG